MELQTLDVERNLGPAETNLDEDGYDEDYLENTGFAETFKINYLNWTDFPEFDPISKEKITRSTALQGRHCSLQSAVNLSLQVSQINTFVLSVLSGLPSRGLFLYPLPS